LPPGTDTPDPGSANQTPEEPLPHVPEEPAEVRPSFLRWALELVALVVIAWIVALAVRTWVIQPFTIPSSSMENTLQIGDYVLVNKFVYRFQSPKPGDVVVFLSPDGDNRDYIKRVVAVGGQTVDVRDGVLYVDGVAKDESYVNSSMPDDYTADGPVTVPAGTVYLMGDNRANSRDSRFFGPQPLGRILGEAFVIYWPIRRAGTL
jgi:signal peptidase I